MKECTCDKLTSTRVNGSNVIICGKCGGSCRGIIGYHGDIEVGPFPDLKMWESAVPRLSPGQKLGKMIVFGTVDSSVTGSEYYKKMFLDPEAFKGKSLVHQIEDENTYNPNNGFSKKDLEDILKILSERSPKEFKSYPDISKSDHYKKLMKDYLEQELPLVSEEPIKSVFKKEREISKFPKSKSKFHK